MFWLARLLRLVRPMPPTPTPAMLSMSLGGVKPRPRTCRGTMAIAAPPVATLVKNLRRDTSFFSIIASPLRCGHYRAVGLTLRMLSSWGRWHRATRWKAYGYGVDWSFCPWSDARRNTGKNPDPCDSPIAASCPDRLRYLVEASVSAHYSFIEDWQEEEAVLPRGGD